MNKSALIDFIKRYDFSFFGMCAAVFFIGVINLYSATHASDSAVLSNLYKSQLIWFGTSISVGIGVSFIKPTGLYRVSYIMYVLNLILLILVLLLGHIGMGAQRWLAIGPLKFQPSEMMKVTVVLALSRWFSTQRPDVPLTFKTLIIPAIIALIPSLLVVVQPDLGTGLLIILIFMVMVFYRQLKWKTFMIILAIGLVAGTITYEFGLKEYQKKRITTFIDPDLDAKGSGYNAIQSKIAIGSGQFFGKGFKKSSQASLSYLPENHTDFIFSIYNEEHGFFGSLVLVSLYVVLFFRFIWLSTAVIKIYDSLVPIGIMAILFWHTFVNMGMVMGLMPIVGLPLPFMSYGGSSLLMFGIACGMATSISNSKNLF